MVSIVSGLLILLLLLSIIFFLRSPHFPDDTLTSKKGTSTSYRQKQEFFLQFSRYLKENHGGLLSSNPLKKKPGPDDSLKVEPAVPTFHQQYQFLNLSLISDLSEDFAAQQGMQMAIRMGCPARQTTGACYQMELKKGKDTWIRILLESTHPVYPEKGNVANYGDAVKVNGSGKTVKAARDTIRLAIVIDDLGYQMDVFNHLISLDFDITYSVLPQQAFSRDTAEIATRAGRQVILHLPMQPKDWPRFDPGLGALLLNDTTEELNAKLTLNLSTVPYVVGVNNHMGSAYSQYADGLDVVMRVLNQNNLFFLDSKTAPGRTAKRSAMKHSVPYLSRDIFLDNDRNEQLIEKQLYKAVRLAKKRGWAIAIGHPYGITYTVLAKQLPKLSEQGVVVTKVNDLLN